MKTIYVKIITPLNIEFEAETKLVTLPGEEGVFGSLPLHSQLTSSLKAGIVTIQLENKIIEYFIYSGIAQVQADSINIITEYAVNILEIKKNEIENILEDLKHQINLEEDNFKIKLIEDNILKYKTLYKFIK